MKKFLLCLAALLPAFSGLSQEFSFVTRAEYSSVEDGHLGNSSIYFTADGNFTENLSYSSELHLLSSTPADLYKGSFYSNTCNWLDWLDLTYDFGPVQFSVGKEILKWGTFENQEYDFDIWNELASAFWWGDNEYTPAVMPSTYQWGTSLNWSITDSQNLAAQVTTSPFGERPFASGLYSFNFQYMIESEAFSGITAFNLTQTEDKSFNKYWSIGVRTELDSWTVTLENSVFFQKPVCTSSALSVSYSPLDNLSFTARGGYEQGLFPDADNRTYAGVLANWYPWEPLRVHALVTYDSLYDNPLFNVGVTWTISL